MPHTPHPLLDSGVLLSPILAVALKVCFNGLGTDASADAGAAHAAVA